jgi:tRNA-Thr(GGU) m(6)t(6)A37 methyltransferase TsaA
LSDGFVVRPIGFVRSPFVEKAQAPRQGATPEAAHATIEVLPEHEHALEDLEGFGRIWILFWFHQAEGARDAKKVLPPRSTKKRGVFATRSPHRPNPIGMTAARLEGVEGCIVRVSEVDILDGTPVLDVKPYIAYADAFPDAAQGWLATDDPQPRWKVTFSSIAEEQVAWADANGADGLRARIVQALALGPQPHAYRRIKKTDAGAVLAVKDWRVHFRDEGRAIVVERLATGWRARDLALGGDPAHALHRAFVARFGER